MNYIYLGQGDLYLPAVAAAIHLKQLNGKAAPDQLIEIPHFRHGGKEDDGRLHFAGRDSDGNNVYVTCVRAQPDVVEKAVMSLLGIYGKNMDEVQVRLCLPENVQVAGICSLLHRLGLKATEVKIASKLAVNRYQDLEKIAAHGTPH